jgi:hypothetical protein
MRKLIVSMAVGVMVALAGFWVTTQSMAAQQPTCLHGQNETPEQQARRQGALGFARQINTLQYATHNRTQAYQPLAQLPMTGTVPQGFVVQVITDGIGYAFSVKDTSDPADSDTSQIKMR